MLTPKYYKDIDGEHRVDCTGIECSQCTISDLLYKDEYDSEELKLRTRDSGSRCGITLYLLLKRSKGNRGKGFKLNRRNQLCSR